MDYGYYALRRNPFPHHGSFPLDDEEEKTYALLMIGREELKKKLDAKLKSLREGESSALVLVIGDYGAGKTHCLKYMEHRSRDKYHNIVPLYIKTVPGPGMTHLLQAFVKSVEATVGREYLSNLAKRYLSSNVGVRCSPDIKNFLKAMAMGREVVALRWVMGYPLQPEERKELGIVSDVDEIMAREVMSTILRLSWRVSHLKILILIDEVEELLKYGKDQVYNFYAGLRDLIDNVSVGMMTVLAATPALVHDEEKGLAILNPALMSRISKENVVTLPPLDKESIKRMLVSYLRAFRTSGTLKYADLYPFTEDALDVIAKVSDGIPRTALKIAGLVLSEGLSKRKVVIDSDFVREVIDVKKELLEEILVKPPAPRPTAPPPPRDGREAIKLRVMKALERVGEVTRSELYRKAGRGMGSKEFYKLLDEMAKEGKIRLVKPRRGRGFRVRLAA